MNRLIVTVENIESIDLINLIKLKIENCKITVLSLELDSKLKKDTQVIIGFKPNKVIVAKNINNALSLSNQFDAKVISVEIGKLLCKLKLSICEDNIISSIFLKNTLKKMDLKVGDKITAFVEASDISILGILS